MDKRQSVLCLIGLLVVLSGFVAFVTPPPPSATAPLPVTINHITHPTSSNAAGAAAAPDVVNAARQTLREANRSYQSANVRIQHIIDTLHEDVTADTDLPIPPTKPKPPAPAAAPPKPPTKSPVQPKRRPPAATSPVDDDEQDKGAVTTPKTTRWCQSRPGTCEFNERERNFMSSWEKSAKPKRTCRAPGEVGRSKDNPVRIQLMDDLGGWSHIIQGIIENTNNGVCETPCHVSGYGGNEASTADVLFTSLYREPADLPRERRAPHQVMAAIGLEAWSVKPAMYDQMDILLSHHPQSQVPVNYYYGLGERCSEASQVNPDEPLRCLDRSIPNFSEKRTDAYSGLFITNCNAAVRRGYLKELGKFIPLHSYGSCLHTPGLSALQGQGAKRREAQKYKFFISFENTVLDGYLSEKFFEGFAMNTLMVYWGAPDMERWLPANHSAINAHDFASPKELASFLQEVASDEAKWNSYFEWKKNDMADMRPEFVERAKNNLSNRGKNNFFCRTCQYYADHYCS